MNRIERGRHGLWELVRRLISIPVDLSLINSDDWPSETEWSPSYTKSLYLLSRPLRSLTWALFARILSRRRKFFLDIVSGFGHCITLVATSLFKNNSGENLFLFFVLAVGLPSHPSDGDGPLGTVALSGPKVSSSHCPFPFSYKTRVSLSFPSPLSLSLGTSIPISHFSLLRLLLCQVNTPIRTRGPACARTHRLRVVSFGLLLPRQLATARPEIPGVRILPSKPSA